MKKNGITLLLIPNNKSSIKEFKIPRFLIYSVIFIVLALVASLSFYSFGYYNKVVDHVKLKSLEEENLALINRLNEINRDILALKQTITSLNKEDDMLRILADLPQIHEDIRRVGVGGPEFRDVKLMEKLSSRTMALTKKTVIDIDQLLREARLQEASFQEIGKKLRAEKDKISRIPTIQPTYGYITAGYGYRRHPFTGRREFHRGIDIANRVGTPVYSSADGVVKHIGYQRAYGKIIIVDHGYGYQTRYAHLHQILIRKGQKVKRHDMIAKMGSSGRSTGPHLHYEVLKGGKWVNPYLHFYSEDIMVVR